MKNNRRIKLTSFVLISFCFGFLFAYLRISIALNEFNLMKWGIEFRDMWIIFGTILTLLISFLLLFIDKYKNESNT